MLRIIRIALLSLVPTFALGALVSACSDDTTNMTAQDMSIGRDLSMPVVNHDMAHGD